jgi:hypothetical protein
LACDHKIPTVERPPAALDLIGRRVVTSTVINHALHRGVLPVLDFDPMR